MTAPSIQESAAALAAALYMFGPHQPDRAHGNTVSLLANYTYQRERLARIADGTATAGDRMTHPDDSYVERDYEAVLRWLGSRRFQLVRDVDETGISGTGAVAEGVVTPLGTAAMAWLTEHRSVAFYASIAEVEAIHGHNGKTRIVFVDEITAG